MAWTAAPRPTPLPASVARVSNRDEKAPLPPLAQGLGRTRQGHECACSGSGTTLRQRKSNAGVWVTSSSWPWVLLPVECHTKATRGPGRRSKSLGGYFMAENHPQGAITTFHFEDQLQDACA